MTIKEKIARLEGLCRGRPCDNCPLSNSMCCPAWNDNDENAVNEAYSIAFPGTDNGIDAKDEHLSMVAEIIAKECDKAVENYKAALLKKIFPYDAVDKKQYSINAYAVWQAINETEVHHD